MKKKISAVDLLVGSLAGTGVITKLNRLFNHGFMATDLVSTVGFCIASFIAGSIVALKCADWSADTREALKGIKIEVTKEKYAQPKEG